MPRYNRGDIILSVFTDISYGGRKTGYDKTAKEECLVDSEHVRVAVGNWSSICFS